MSKRNKETIKELRNSMILAVVVILLIVVMFKMKPITLNLNGQQLKEKDFMFGDVADFLLLSERFAATHEYDIEDYNCKNYTRDLKAIADELGFKVKREYGCKSSNFSNCHVWLTIEVDFEPQSNEFVDYTKTYPYRHSLTE